MPLRFHKFQISAVVIGLLASLVPWVHLTAKQLWNLSTANQLVDCSILCKYLILLNLAQLVTIFAMVEAACTREELGHDTSLAGRDGEASITSNKVAHDLASDPWSVLTIGSRTITTSEKQSPIDISIDHDTDLLKDLILEHKEGVQSSQQLAPMDRFLNAGTNFCYGSAIDVHI